MYKILDTNIILLDAYNIIKIASSDDIIVLPETVIDEIDSKKSGVSEIAFQAREFGRLLSKAEVLSKSRTPDLFTLNLLLEGVQIRIQSMESYPSFSDSESNIIRDRKIIHIAKLYRSLDHEFITNDIMCRIRASAEGLVATDLKIVDNTKELTVDSELFSDLHRLSILEVDIEHSTSNYNYIFKDETTGQTKLATVSNGLISIIGRETEKDLRKQDLNPMNSGQLFLSKAIQDPTIDIVVAEASAGTGCKAA